jgi:uncharacterized protein (TIGR03086 family)
MADVVERLRVAIAGFDRAVDTAAANDAWARPSPCEGWSAGDVLDHLSQNYARLSRECGNPVPSSGERRADWVSARDALLHAASEPGALDRPVNGPGGEMPLGRMLAAFVTTDTLVHTWDIARAVGGDESIDEELSRRAFDRALPADEMLRASGMFGAKLDYDEGAPVQTKLLRFFGRPA